MITTLADGRRVSAHNWLPIKACYVDVLGVNDDFVLWDSMSR